MNQNYLYSCLTIQILIDKRYFKIYLEMLFKTIIIKEENII